MILKSLILFISFYFFAGIVPYTLYHFPLPNSIILLICLKISHFIFQEYNYSLILFYGQIHLKFWQNTSKKEKSETHFFFFLLLILILLLYYILYKSFLILLFSCTLSIFKLYLSRFFRNEYLTVKGHFKCYTGNLSSLRLCEKGFNKKGESLKMREEL